jgi:hypothetical protein
LGLRERSAQRPEGPALPPHEAGAPRQQNWKESARSNFATDVANDSVARSGNLVAQPRRRST